MGGPTELWGWSCGCINAVVDARGLLDGHREGRAWDLRTCAQHITSEAWLLRAAWCVDRARDLGVPILKARHGFGLEHEAAEIEGRGWLPTSNVVALPRDVPHDTAAVPDGLRLREARSADRPRVVAWISEALLLGTHPVETALLPDGACQQRATEIVDSRHALGVRVLVAANEDGPVGHVSFTAGHKDPVGGSSWTEILDVFIDREWRGRGVSQALTSEVVRLSRESGDASVRGTVSRLGNTNAPAIHAALRALGWRRIGGRVLRDLSSSDT